MTADGRKAAAGSARVSGVALTSARGVKGARVSLASGAELTVKPSSGLVRDHGVLSVAPRDASELSRRLIGKNWLAKVAWETTMASFGLGFGHVAAEAAGAAPEVGALLGSAVSWAWARSAWRRHGGS